MIQPGVLGDQGDSRQWALKDGTDPLDLTNVTTAHVHFKYSTTTITVTASIDTPLTSGLITVPVGTFLADSTCRAATWNVETELDAGMASELSVPSGPSDKMVVRAELA